MLRTHGLLDGVFLRPNNLARLRLIVSSSSSSPRLPFVCGAVTTSTGGAGFSLLSVISKGKSLYSAVSSPQDCSKCFNTLLPRQICSIKYHLNFSGKHPATCYKLMCKKLLVHIATTVYSQVLIYTAEWTGVLLVESEALHNKHTFVCNTSRNYTIMNVHLYFPDWSNKIFAWQYKP